MQIQLKQSELESAVTDYVCKMGITLPVTEIRFTASRGSAGVITDVEVAEPGSAPPVRGTRPTAVNEASVTVGEPEPDTQEEAAPAAEKEEEPSDSQDEEEAPADKNKSLFG